MIKKIAAVVLIILGLVALYNNVSWFMRYIYPLHYKELIIKYSAEYNVDPYLVASVIKVESNFSHDVVSSKGAIGLMQLMPKTATWAAEKIGIEDLELEDLKNPDVNINIGTWYLALLLREFNNDITLALAAYNGGQGNVAKWIEKGHLVQKKEEEIPFPETRDFVLKVKKCYRWYKHLYEL